jgi:hypothetical protein
MPHVMLSEAKHLWLISARVRQFDPILLLRLQDQNDIMGWFVEIVL